MINLKKYSISKKDPVLIAVSGGPDSMCLLDLLVNKGFKPIVCHVNYHKRDTADRDENIVKNYCNSNNLVFFGTDYDLTIKGNFQDQARIFRYKFFKEKYDEYKCKALFIAHQLDDCLETYIFRMERNSKSRSLTIKEEDNSFGMRIIRPLIKHFKEETEKYCVKHSIVYGIDESNSTNDYSRNRIRNTLKNEKTVSDKKKMVKQMYKDVKKWDEFREKTLQIMQNNVIPFDKLLNSYDDEVNILMFELINTKCIDLAHSLNSGRIRQMIFDLNNDQNNAEIELERKVYLVREGNDLYIYKVPTVYTYFLEKMGDKCQYNKEDGSKMEGIYVNEDDYPLVIRPYRDDDFVELKEGHKSVNKLFQDKKIPHCKRIGWLVIENKDGKIIYVNKLYRDYSRMDLQNNLFII